MVSYRSKNLAYIVLLVLQFSFCGGILAAGFTLSLRPSESTGVQQIIVLPVFTEDTPPSTSIRDLQDVMDKVDDYYWECSYHKLIFSSTVAGWVRIPQEMTDYATVNTYGDVEHGGAKDSLIVEAIKANEFRVDFWSYDRLVVVHSGYSRQSPEISDNKTRISTCHKEGWYTTLDGRTFTGVSVVSEYDLVGSVAHELGHDLGASDLYDYHSKNPPSTGISYWGLMSSGNHNGNPDGSKPSHMSSFAKLESGLIQDSDVYEFTNGSLSIDLVPIACQTRGYRAIRYHLPDGRYYLVEARSKIGYDSSLPDYGVLVMLVNETRIKLRRDAVRLQVPIQSNSLSDASLREGETFFDKNNSFAVRVNKWTKSGVTIEISDTLTEDWIISERIHLQTGHHILAF
ncbi:MAG: M6 family metalloprotease domain-containing protein [Candidatus Thorarchaeota archaeon]